MSRIPSTSRSCLPQVSRLKPPTAGCRSSPRLNSKRRPSNDENIELPSKRPKVANDSSTGSHDFKAPTSRAPPRGKLRRSVSMANMSTSVSNTQSRFKSGLLSNGRPSVSASTLPGSRPSMPVSTNRRPGTNITSQVNNRLTSARSSVNVKSAVNLKAPAPPDSQASKGKPKRAGWDLKGQLQDARELVKSGTLEKANLQSKLATQDAYVATLEDDRDRISEELEEIRNEYNITQEALDKCRTQLSEEKEQRYEERKRLEREVEQLEFSKRSAERQIKNLESELSIKTEELVQLRSSVASMTSQMSSTKTELECTTFERNKLKKELDEALELVTKLKDTVNDGETMRRKLHNTIQELKGNIRVFCRVRPLIGEEIALNGNSTVIHHINVLDEKSLDIIKGGNSNSSTMSGLKSRGGNSTDFSFDRVFGPGTTQAEAFEEISQLVQSALDGYNVCVFAYGQTGSGKTFTMEGVNGDDEMEGMIPRTVKNIFSSMVSLKEKGWDYNVEVSFLEIYNETIRDLLVSPSVAKNNVYEIKLVGKTNDTYVTNLQIKEVTTLEEVLGYLKVAQRHRAVAATNMNERSSRSHSVFRLKLTGTNEKTAETCEGTLNLVDLAGSERLKESGSEGARLTETQNINKSLSNLGNVTMALAQKQSFIPYRNSKLTYLLQNSLGGNSKTLMFVNISPVDTCLNETLNSLRFAAKVNQCHIGTATKQAKK